MNPWVGLPLLLLAAGAAAGWLSNRLPPSGWVSLALAGLPLGGGGLMAMH